MSSSASSSSLAHERGESACAGTASTATTTPPSESSSPSLPASIPSVDFIDYLTQQKAALLQLFTSTQARGSPSATVTTAGPVPAPHRRCADAQARTDASVHHGPARGAGSVHSANAPRCTPPQPSQRTATTSDADARHHADKNPLSGFLSYLALPGVYTEVQHMMEPTTPAAGPAAEALPHAAYASSSCSAATSVSASASQSTMTSTTNATGAAAASSTSSSCCPSSAAVPCSHVHQFRPTQFIMPVLCKVCKAAMLDVKVWPSPLPRQLSAPPPASNGADSDGGGAAASAAAGPAAASPFSFFTFLASPATPALADAAPPADVASPNASPPPPPSRCTEPTHVPQAPPSSSTPTAAPSQPFLAFGTQGYRCGTCGIALHLQCLSKMRDTQACEVLAPLAHAMPSDAAGPTSDAAPSSSASSSSSSGGGFSGPFSWDRVKAMVGTYLDPSDGAYSRRDGNVKAVLEGVFALLDTVIARYPTLTPFTFVKRYPAMQELSTAHQTLYTACTASLQDTTLLRRISWADLQRHRRERTGAAAASSQAPPSTASAVLRPLRVDKSVLATIKASMTGASSSSTSSGGGSIGNSIFSSSLFSKSVVTPMTGAAAAAGAAPRASGEESTEMGTARSDDAAAAAASEGGDDETGGLPRATSPVQLLLWNAMRYATAAYGEVYRRGSLSSTITATLLFTVNRSGVEVPKPVNDAAVTTLLDLPASSLRLSRWASQATEPSYALLVDDAAGRIVVAFRGTLNTFDIMTDLAAVGQAFCGGYAHQGAAEVVNTLFEQRASHYGATVEARRRVQRTEATSAGPETKEAGVVGAVRDGNDEAPQPPLAAPDASAPSTSATAPKVLLTPYVLQPLSAPDGLLDGLGELAAAYPTYSILITGHSLGGGVAVLFATRLHHDRALPESVLRRVHVIAFAPMPTLSLPAASCFDATSCAPEDGGYTSRPSHATATGGAAGAPATPAPACFPVWSVVNGFDCVPRLQVNTIDRLIRQIVGPQLASASAQPPTFLSASASSSTAAAGAVEARRRAVRERRQRSEARDDAAGQTSPTEMTDMPALGHAEGGASCSVDSDVCNPPPPRGSDAADGTTSTSPTPIEAHAVEVEREVVVRARRPSATARSRTSKLDAVSHTGGKPVWPARDSHAAHDLSQELHHPGRVLLLTSPWDMSTNRLVDVPRGHPVMHELFLMKSMLLQHMVDAYSGALGQINEGSAPRGA